MLNYNLAELQEPWLPISENASDYVSELNREAPPGHVLFGINAEAIARRDDVDDVLFRFHDGFAVVHLTYAKSEHDPGWPTTTIYKDWNEFLSQRMKLDVQEYGETDI